jgi:hypothetical protein
VGSEHPGPTTGRTRSRSFDTLATPPGSRSRAPRSALPTTPGTNTRSHAPAWECGPRRSASTTTTVASLCCGIGHRPVLLGRGGGSNRERLRHVSSSSRAQEGDAERRGRHSHAGAWERVRMARYQSLWVMQSAERGNEVSPSRQRQTGIVDPVIPLQCRNSDEIESAVSYSCVTFWKYKIEGAIRLPQVFSTPIRVRLMACANARSGSGNPSA